MRRNRVITLRASDEEVANLKRWAAHSGMTLAEYIRSKAGPAVTVTSASSASFVWRAALASEESAS